MAATTQAQAFEKTRLQVARRVRELRSARKWTQGELASRLNISQGRLSELERGQASFTAEQFLELLALFNVSAADFAPRPRDHDRELQNALARQGALHLRESAGIVPSERFEQVDAVVRETLVAQAPRQIAALAPVLVSNIDHLNLQKLQLDLSRVGLDRRLAWVVDNTVEAIRRELPDLPEGPWTEPYRRAALILGLFRDSVDATVPRWDRNSIVDVVEPGLVTKQTFDELLAECSPVSLRWGVLSSLQVQDFVDALRDARDR